MVVNYEVFKSVIIIIHNCQMASMSTARVVKPFHLPSIATMEMDHGIDHANVNGLVSLNFFIMV